KDFARDCQECQRDLGPKPILALLVALIFAELGHLSILQSPHVHFRKGRGNPASLSIDCGQDNDKIAFSKHIVQVDAEYTSGQFHCALKEAYDLVMAPVIPRERTVTGHVPSNASIKRAKYSGNVSACKVLVGPANNLGIGFRHAHLPPVDFLGRPATTLSRES